MALLTGCDVADAVNDVSNQMGAMIEGGATTLEVAELSANDWDHLFVFGPYSPKNAVCQSLTLPTADCRDSRIPEHVDEGTFLLVFMKGSKLVHLEHFSRKFGDFAAACLGRSIPRERAIFRVSRGTVTYLTCPE